MATRLNVVNPPLREARNDLIYPPRADFRWDFTSSIIPQQSMGVVSFTRATTATVTDNDWIIRNCLSGEARFKWARRIENNIRYSEAIDNAAWTKSNLTVVANTHIAPNGTMTADTLKSTTTPAIFSECIQPSTLTTVVWNKYTYSAYVKSLWQQFVQILWNVTAFNLAAVNFDIINGTVTQTAVSPFAWSITPEANWYFRVSATFTCTWVLATGRMSIWFIDTGTSARGSVYNGDGVKAIAIWGQQYNDTTLNTVRPSEYVSTDVLSAPFHGANVDWVKYFDTDANWVAIPKTTLKWLLVEWTRKNICSYSDLSATWWSLQWASRTSFAWTAPDGTNSMVKIIPNVGTQSSYAYNVNITTTAQQYTVSCYVKAAWFNFVQFRFSSSISNWYANFDLQNGVVWTMSLWTSSGIETTSIAWVYRVWAVTDTVAATTAAVGVQVVPAANSLAWASITGDWVSGILAWGMQVENWPSVSSYIPTTTTTATRNIDVLTYDVRNAIVNQWALSLVCSMNDNAIFDRRAFSLSSFTINRLHVRARALAQDKLDIAYWDGVTVRTVTGVAVWTNNIAVSWTNWVWLNLYMNNIKYIGAFAPSLVFSTIDVGGGDLWYSLFWCIKNVRIWKTPPTDAELLALSNSSY